MNFYNQIPRSTFVVIDSTGTLNDVSVHTITPPTVEDMQLKKSKNLKRSMNALLKNKES